MTIMRDIIAPEKSIKGLDAIEYLQKHLKEGSTLTICKDEFTIQLKGKDSQTIALRKKKYLTDAEYRWLLYDEGQITWEEMLDEDKEF